LADDEFWFWVLALAIAVLAGGAAALRWVRIARLIEDTPTSRVRSAAQGYVELAGRGTPLPGTQNLAPLTQRPCLWWRYRIARRVERSSGSGGRRGGWQVVTSGTSSVPFVLDDDTGQCLVKPQGAEILSAEATTWYGDTPWPTVTPARTRWIGGERTYRYHEERIYEHERLYALGNFASTTAMVTDDGQAAAALLTEWKDDQAALLERFDRDRDGRIDLDEWERARSQARRDVTERRTGQPAVPAAHVLCRPDDGRLFLIAAFPPGDLARRYRRRAAFAFGGFVGGVYALAWLLQRAFD
jgi:hypothetical protein